MLSKTCKNIFYLKILLDSMQHCKNIEINWLCSMYLYTCRLAISRKNITVKLLIISSYKETPPCFLSRDLLPTLNPTTRPLKLEMKNLKIVFFFFLKERPTKKNILYVPFGYKTWKNNNKIEAQPGLDDSNTNLRERKIQRHMAWSE